MLFGKVEFHRNVVGLLDAQTHQICRLTEELLGLLVPVDWGRNNGFYGLLGRLWGTLGCGQTGSGHPSRLNLHGIGLLLGVTRSNQDHRLTHMLLELGCDVAILCEIHMDYAIHNQFDNAQCVLLDPFRGRFDGDQLGSVFRKRGVVEWW